MRTLFDSALLIILWSSVSLAADAETAIAFNIEQQPLAAVLNQFARQSDRQILFSTEVVNAKHANGIKGTWEPEVALEKLLKGTGLTFQVTTDQTILVDKPGDTANVPVPFDSIRLAQVGGSGSEARALKQDIKERNTELEEVLVTAQKRVESVQQIPIAITALGGEELRALGIRDARDLAGQTPGLTAKPSLSDQNILFTVRGVGLNSFFAANNPSASVYVNQVPLPFHPMMAFQMFDMERVEVLKGPQGTLYGRNTTSGAVNFITRKPTEELEGYLDLGYGSYRDGRLEAAVGGGLAPGWRGRASVLARERGSGWERNRVTGEKIGDIDRLAGRGMLAWTVNESVEVLMDVHGGREDSDALEYEHAGTRASPGPAGAPCAPVLAGRRADGTCVDMLGYFDPESNPYTGDYSGRNGLEVDTWGASLTVDWMLPRFTITSVFGYESYERQLNFDGDASPYAVSDNEFFDDIETWSEELRLTSDASWPVEWIVGFTYGEDDINGDFIARGTDAYASDLNAPYAQKTSTAAGFGHFKWPFAERWRLNGGIRYTHEKREFFNATLDLAPLGVGTSIFQLAGICQAQSPVTVTPVVCSQEEGSFSDSDLSGTVGVDYSPTDDWLIYAKFSKGFKSGGINAAINFNTNQSQPFRPEELYAWEAGFKATLGGAVRLNAAAYYYDWQDMQVFTLNFAGPIAQRVLTNAGQGEVVGAEVDVLWMPAAWLKVWSGVNWNDTKVTDFETVVAAADATGNVFANTPEFSFSGRVQAQWPLDRYGMQVVALTDFSWRDHQYFEIANRPFFRESGYWLLNARLALEWDSWEVAVWARNLTDERYRVDAIDFDRNAGANINVYGEPRTAGFSVHYRF